MKLFFSLLFLSLTWDQIKSAKQVAEEEDGTKSTITIPNSPSECEPRKLRGRVEPPVPRPWSKETPFPTIMHPYAEDIKECEKTYCANQEEDWWCGKLRCDKKWRTFKTPCHWECNRYDWESFIDGPCPGMPYASAEEKS